MLILSNLALAIVASLHIGFLVLEMFLWTKPLGQKVFGLSAETMKSSAALAANQGLYNGFLAAGLLWGLYLGPEGFAVKMFFLGCVIVAGLFGAATAKRSILWTQALPGAIAIILVYFTR
jgi:putative membrane protein